MFDAFSEARRHAVLMREFYEAYIAAGFSPEESMEMVKIMLAFISTPQR